MKKQKRVGAISVCVLGVLSALSHAEAMLSAPWSTLFDKAIFPRKAIAVEGELVTLPQSDASQVETGMRVVWVPQCADMQSIVVPWSVAVLREHCFKDCQSLAYIALEAGSQLAAMGEGAFQGCLNLQSIHLPASVERIGASCFSHCRSLFAMTFASGSRLVTMGEEAFYECSSLQSLYLPASVERIGASCFSRCRSLFSAVFAPDSQLQIMEPCVFLGSGLRSICIPAGVQALERRCLASCSSLISVTFAPDSQLVKIGTGAFFDSSLQSMVVPARVQKLEMHCFFNCSSLASVTFDEGSQLRAVEDRAFSGSVVKSVRFPPNVDFGTFVFIGCSCIEKIYCGDRWADVLSGVYAGTTILQSVTIPHTASEIREACFQCCKSLVSVTFEAPSQLRRIGANAFARSGVRFVVIPASTEVLGDTCFALCPSLFSVTFEAPSQLVTVGDEAFSRSILKCIYFPHLVNMGPLIFLGSHVKKIYFGNEQASFFSGVYAGTRALRVLTIPPTVVMIKAGCFQCCKSLLGIFFEAGSQLTTIEQNAFYNSGLRSITFPPSLVTLREGCFAWCPLLTAVTFQNGFQLQVVEWGVFTGSLCAQVFFPNGGIFSAAQLEQGWTRDPRPLT
ncbi:MAG: leucine-rich repeat domain-containing protein [Holosporales bacterium]|nr:leucine-rich repeat domain-containing protein [Holosporales bacterium]